MPRPAYLFGRDGPIYVIALGVFLLVLLAMAWWPLSLWFGLALAASPELQQRGLSPEPFAGFFFAWSALVWASFLYVWYCDRNRRQERVPWVFVTAFALGWFGPLALEAMTRCCAAVA